MSAARIPNVKLRSSSSPSPTRGVGGTSSSTSRDDSSIKWKMYLVFFLSVVAVFFLIERMVLTTRSLHGGGGGGRYHHRHGRFSRSGHGGAPVRDDDDFDRQPEAGDEEQRQQISAIQQHVAKEQRQHGDAQQLNEVLFADGGGGMQHNADVPQEETENHNNNHHHDGKHHRNNKKNFSDPKQQASELKSRALALAQRQRASPGGGVGGGVPRVDGGGAGDYKPKAFSRLQQRMFQLERMQHLINRSREHNDRAMSDRNFAGKSANGYIPIAPGTKGKQQIGWWGNRGGPSRGGRRRPLQTMAPLSNCTLRRMKFVPPFTRPSKHSKRPRFAVLSLVAKRNGTADNSTRRSTMNEYVFINKVQYCQLHGYDFIVEGDSAVDRRRAPAWSKVRALRKWLPYYDWIMWTDQDTMFTNWSFRIEDIVHEQLQQHLHRDMGEQQRMAKSQHKVFDYKEKAIDLIMTKDWNNINSGVFFIRNCKWSLDFLKRMWSVPQRLASPFWDQGAMIYLISPLRGRPPRAAAADRSHFWITDDNYFNAYPENFIREERNMWFAYEQGDAVVHFASCRYFSYCLEWVRYMSHKALCENQGLDAPHANYTPPDVYYPPDDTASLATFPPLVEVFDPLPQRVWNYHENAGPKAETEEEFTQRKLKDLTWRKKKLEEAARRVKAWNRNKGVVSDADDADADDNATHHGGGAGGGGVGRHNDVDPELEELSRKRLEDIQERRRKKRSYGAGGGGGRPQFHGAVHERENQNAHDELKYREKQHHHHQLSPPHHDGHQQQHQHHGENSVPEQQQQRQQTTKHYDLELELHMRERHPDDEVPNPVRLVHPGDKF